MIESDFRSYKMAKIGLAKWPPAAILKKNIKQKKLRIYLKWREMRSSRVWDSLLVMKSGCAAGRGFVPRPGQYSKESVSSYQETGKVFSPEMPFYSKF